MRRFVTSNCLIHSEDLSSFSFPSDVVQNLRQVVLAPALYQPNIQGVLQTVGFKFHRSCSICSITQECNVGEGQTLLMFWACERSDSKATMSVTASSTSLQFLPTTQTNNPRDLRSVAQQTDISCRHISGFTTPGGVPEADEHRVLRARLADSLTFSSPPSSLFNNRRSMSILSSVCALLLKKQVYEVNQFSKPPTPEYLIKCYLGSTLAPKEVSSLSSPVSDNICRICFGGESAERLVRPCSCRGTIAAVHRTCLERWLLQAATSYCELCRHHYIVTRSHKWSWARSVVEWARSGRGAALAADAWRGAALGAASVLGTARALHACDRVLQAAATRGGSRALAANLFSSVLIGVIGALNGLLTTWMLLKIQEHQLSWQTWRDSTLHVHVTLEDDHLSPHPSDVTIVADDADSGRADRSTNVADPFMVAVPYTFPSDT